MSVWLGTVVVDGCWVMDTQDYGSLFNSVAFIYICSKFSIRKS